MNCKSLGIFCLVIFSSIIISAQNTSLQVFDLYACIDYAKEHYPLFKQSQIDQQITERHVKIGWSKWYPQVGFATQLQHANADQLASISAGGQTYLIELNKKNIHPLSLSVNQALFNKDALFSARTATSYRQNANLNIRNERINLQANVSKAYYNVLLQQRQLEIYDSDIERLEEVLKDTQSQYEGGIVDITDVRRSRIALNNAKARYQNAQQMVAVSYANLKQVIGYNTSENFIVQENIQSFIPEMYIDTTQVPEIKNRVEHDLLLIQQKLLAIDLNYSRWAYIPTISLFGSYNVNYSSDYFSSLYQGSPFSDFVFGISLSVPLFEGFSRTHQIKLAKLNLKRNEWDFKALNDKVNAEFIHAIAIYKSNMENYNFLKQNREEAEKVFDIISLQYREGVKTYLDLILAHSDLITAKLEYYNSIFTVITSKIDVQIALGEID